MKSNYHWATNVKITTFDLNGRIIHVAEFKNLLMTVGKNMMRDVLGGVVTDGQIKYLAVGTDATAPAIGQTTLVAEGFRKITTSRSYPSTGVIKTIHYLSPDDALINIREMGWFAGAAATASANTGIMVARILYTRTKTNLESITVERTDTITEA